jgi:septum formation protein
LASSSPRRRDLLAAAGIPFETVPSEAEEATGGSDPRRLVQLNALAKARGARLPAGTREGTFVLGADTVVVEGGSILGKPADADEAADMLRRLSGEEHHVVTGVALLRVGAEGAARELVGASVTAVRFRPLSGAEIEAYLVSDEWRGKAGAYAIQGLASLFVQGIEGDHSNVVGLPLSLVGELLRAAGYDPVRRVWSS